MRQQLLHIVCIVVLLLPARTVSAQTTHALQPPITLKATVDKRQILIGQPIQLMLEATVPGTAPLNWPLLDTLTHFEFVEKGKVDSIIHPGERYYRQYLTITSFDSGAWCIPRLPFIMGPKKYFTDSVRIEVVFTKFDPNQDYHDIRDIIDTPNPFAKWIGWIVAAVTLLSLVLVIWLVKKKKLLKAAPSAITAQKLSPYEEALRQLEELQKQRLAENGSVKLYYTRLNDILRVFILRRLGIASLAETNEELIREIRRLPLSAGEFSQLAETLRMSDFVKFAKYQPGISDNENNFGVIRSSIERLNELEKLREAERSKEAERLNELRRSNDAGASNNAEN